MNLRRDAGLRCTRSDANQIDCRLTRLGLAPACQAEAAYNLQERSRLIQRIHFHERVTRGVVLATQDRSVIGWRKGGLDRGLVIVRWSEPGCLGLRPVAFVSNYR